jgi:hypothetical protein
VKGILQNMTAFLKEITGFYEYTKGIFRNMTVFYKYYCTVPAAVRHIPQTARAKHNQSLREEPSSTPRYHIITMTLDLAIMIK